MLFVALILLIVFVLYKRGVFSYRSAEARGQIDENTVRTLIGDTVPGVQYVINDFKMRVADGHTVQVDHILINSRGIFVIETKNYSGRIYGKENSLEWTQVLNYGKVKNKLYNPLKQNKSHVYHISKLLPFGIPIRSAVVFVQGNIQYIEAPCVYTLYGLKRLVSTGEAVFNSDEMKNIYDILCEKNDLSIENVEHVQNVRAIQHNIAMNICPRCGKQLVSRIGRNGPFTGCSGYPACRFTKR